MGLVRLLVIYQAGPEKVSVASASPRTKALCELKGQTQAPLSGRSLGKAQGQPGTSHLAAWASSRDTVPWGFFLSRARQSSLPPPVLLRGA